MRRFAPSWQQPKCWHRCTRCIPLPYGPILHILKGYRRNIPLYHFLLLVITDEVWSAWGATRQVQVSLCCTLQRSFLLPPALAQWDLGTALCLFAGLCLRGKKDWKFLGMLSLSASWHWTDRYRRQLRLASVLIWLQAFKSRSPTYEDTALKNLDPALRRTFAVLSPAMVASCCAMACPQWSAARVFIPEHQHSKVTKPGQCKAYGSELEIPLDTSKVQSVWVKWLATRCCKIGKILW